MALYKTEYDGVLYTWIEKGQRACLVTGGTQLLWMGDPCDPVSIRKLAPAAPLAVLLELSVLRGLDRT